MEKRTLENYISKRNLNIFSFVKYKFVPKLLSKYDVLLMPYEEKVMVNSKSLNTSKYMSPLKCLIILLLENNYFQQSKGATRDTKK